MIAEPYVPAETRPTGQPPYATPRRFTARTASSCGGTAATVVFWNCGGGPSPEKLGWLLQQEWDTSILVEVSGAGRDRLREHQRVGHFQLWLNTAPRSGRKGRRLTVAVLTRDGTEVVQGQETQPTLGQSRFQERVGATHLHHPSLGRLSVVGAHMPHGVGGQSDKELAYLELSTWLTERSDPLILGIDTNTWTNRATAPRARSADPKFQHQRNFQVIQADHGLHDAWVQAAEKTGSLHDPGNFWTYDTGRQRHRWDQIWVSAHLRCISAEVLTAAPGTARGAAHRPVRVTLLSEAAHQGGGHHTTGGARHEVRASGG